MDYHPPFREMCPLFSKFQSSQNGCIAGFRPEFKEQYSYSAQHPSTPEGFWKHQQAYQQPHEQMHFLEEQHGQQQEPSFQAHAQQQEMLFLQEQHCKEIEEQRKYFEELLETQKKHMRTQEKEQFDARWKQYKEVIIRQQQSQAILISNLTTLQKAYEEEMEKTSAAVTAKEEEFQKMLRAHEEFHDKELQDQKIIIRRLETLYKSLKDDQIQNSSSLGFFKQEKEEPVLQQILSYSKLIPAAQSILEIPIQHVKEVCNFDFQSFNNFLPEQQIEEECNPPQEMSHLERVDSFQGPFDLFKELPGFVSEQEDEVHTPQEKNQSLLMLTSEQQEEDNDLTTLIIQDSPDKVCNGPLPGKIKNNDDASFWDDLEAFITELDVPHISAEKTNPVQEVVIEKNVMETLDQGGLMVENFGNTRCIGKPTGLPSFDQQHQVYEMIPLPFDSLEFNTPNQFDVILERKDEKVNIKKSELEFFITRGCPIRHCAKMDLKHEASYIKEKLPPAYASQTCVNFDRIQEISAQYHKTVPYHNFRHACDVLHCTYLLLTTVEAGKLLNNLEKLALVLAALCHDVDHPGLTNAFLINCNDPLAIRYNDISVLENHHASTTVKTLLAHESLNILSNLTDSEQGQVRKLMVNLIISTDMSLHADVLKSVKDRMNESRHFQFSPPCTPEKDGSQFYSSSTLDPSSTSDALLLMRMLIKCADISNIVKPFSLSKQWAELLLVEWFRQGDLEKKLGLPVSKNMDREDPSTIRNITVGFIDYVGKELYETTSLLLPKMKDEVLPNLRANLHDWACYNTRGYCEEEESGVIGARIVKAATTTLPAIQEVENIPSTSSPRLEFKILRQSTLESESSICIEGPLRPSHLSMRSDHPISPLLEAPIKQRKSSTVEVKPGIYLNDGDMEIDLAGPPTSGCMNQHSMLPSLSEWKQCDMATCPKFCMIARTNPYAVNINNFLESRFWQCIILPMSLFAIFADDIQKIFLPKSVDSYIVYIYLLCLALFLLEFMLLSVVRDGYFCSLSFWLDLIGSLSLVPLSLGKSNLNLIMARSIKAAKTFTHAAKWMQNGGYMKSSQLSSALKLVRCKGSISPSEEGKKMDCDNSYCFRGKPSEIWTRLSELTSEKLAFGMLMIVLMYIRFLPGRLDLGPEASLRILDHQPLHSMVFNVSLNHLLKFYKDHNYELLYLGSKNGCLPSEPSLLKYDSSEKVDSCNGIDLAEDYNQIIPQHGMNAKVDAEKKYRDTELLKATSDSRRSEAYFSVKHYNQLRHSKNLGLTVVTLFTLSAWSFLLSWDSNKLLIQPIERMVSFVKELADDPVSFAGKVVPEHPGDGKVMETRFIEASLIKIASLTKVALGDAGMDILSVNLKGSEFNPMVPGKKVRACFGFCDIRNFTDATECLQEEVMMFVNRIADLIHNKVILHHGFPNKNIGDAFLIVWKKTISDAASKHFDQNGTSFADRALRSFLDIIHAVETSQALREYAMHPAIQKRMPGYQIRLGFGLHAGWAIEGAIGSSHKVDPSYLSPHVNMASRLEAATKQYGVCLLVSETVVANLTKSSLRDSCRKLDRVTVKGSTEPMLLYTYDMPFLQKDLRGSPQVYKRLFEAAIDNYIIGNWTEASTKLKQCIQMWPTDKPAILIANYMASHNNAAPAAWKGYRVLKEK